MASLRPGFICHDRKLKLHKYFVTKIEPKTGSTIGNLKIDLWLTKEFLFLINIIPSSQAISPHLIIP